MDANSQALVFQLGAREHYLAARSFARHGRLACLATDFWSSAQGTAWRRWRWLPKAALSALARHHPALDGQRVISFPALGVFRYGLGVVAGIGRHDSRIADFMAARVGRLAPPHGVFFGYSYESLEMLRAERRRGVFTILCQTDPGPAHYRMAEAERKQWPEFGAAAGGFWTREREERLRGEWELADVIVVNSEWSRDSIVAEGADPAKVEILPLAYEIGGEGAGERGAVSEGAPGAYSAASPLKVLWLGNLTLAKGIQYLVAAARRLEGEPVEFVVAGTSYIAPAVLANGPKNVRWLGRIPRSATSELYRQCQVFVFPTLSDGFGITQLEALGHGLPVIATHNCARVVEEGVTGFMVPARDVQALAEAILRFVRHPGLARQMRADCHKGVGAFSVSAYGQRLLEIVRQHSEVRRAAAICA